MSDRIDPIANPFAGLDMHWLLEMQAQRFAEKTLLTWAPFDAPARHYTYGEFYDLVGRLAAALKKRGVKAGDRILVHLENCPEFLLSWFAVAECGAIAVTTNTRSVADELKYYIEHSGCSGAITQPSLFGVLKETATTDLIKWVILTEHDNGAPPAAQGDVDPGDKFSAVLRTPPLNPRRQVEADPTRPIAVQYTSGTTSRPKGVLMTHANWLWQGRVMAACAKTTFQLVYAPLFHVNALGYSFVPAVWKGATAVLMPRYSTSRFWSVAVRTQDDMVVDDVVRDEGACRCRAAAIPAVPLLEHGRGRARAGRPVWHSPDGAIRHDRNPVASDCRLPRSPERTGRNGPRGAGIWRACSRWTKASRRNSTSRVICAFAACRAFRSSRTISTTRSDEGIVRRRRLVHHRRPRHRAAQWLPYALPTATRTC